MPQNARGLTWLNTKLKERERPRQTQKRRHKRLIFTKKPEMRKFNEIKKIVINKTNKIF